MPKGSLNVSLKGADDIFSTEESRQEQQREQVQQIPIGELFPFKNGAGTQRCPGKGHELSASGRPDDAEHPFFIVKLPHQVNDEVALPCKAR